MKREKIGRGRITLGIAYLLLPALILTLLPFYGVPRRLLITCLSISSVKYSPANVSAYIVKLVSFSPFDRRDSDKTEKTNISLLSSMAVAYMNIE